jgi:hypothetical protein
MEERRSEGAEHYAGRDSVSYPGVRYLGNQRALGRLGGIMLGSLLFIACVVLQFHYHDSIPWYIWLAAVIALCVSFGEPAMRLKKE